MPADLMSPRYPELQLQALGINPTKAKEARILPAGEWLPHLSPPKDIVSIRVFERWVIIPRLLGLDNTGYETRLIFSLSFEYHLLPQHKN